MQHGAGNPFRGDTAVSGCMGLVVARNDDGRNRDRSQVGVGHAEHGGLGAGDELIRSLRLKDSCLLGKSDEKSSATLFLLGRRP